MEDKGLMRQLLFFDSMVAPKIITFIYWFMLAIIVVSSMAIASFNLLVAIVAMLVLSLNLRVMMELLIVIFKINANLQDIRDLQVEKSGVIKSDQTYKK